MLCQIKQLHYLLAGSLSSMSEQGLKQQASAPRHTRAVADVLLPLLQFRSISYNLWGTEDFHKGVRRRAVEHIRSNRQALPRLSSVEQVEGMHVRPCSRLHTGLRSC